MSNQSNQSKQSHRLFSLVAAAALVAGCTGGSASNGNNTGVGQPESTGNESTAPVDAGATETADAAPAAPPPPPPHAHVRVIHASPATEAAAVAVYLDGAQTPAIASLAYKAVVGYLEVPVGEHAVDVRPASAAASTPAVVSARTPALEADKTYTVIAHGLVGAQPALALTAAADDPTQPEAGHARVRFFHAGVGAGAVDLCLPGANARAAGTPVFANVAYGAFGAPTGGAAGGYADVPSGREIILQIRAQNARVCSGRVAGLVRITPADRAVLTAIAVGRATGTPALEVLGAVDVAHGESTAMTMAVTAR